MIKRYTIKINGIVQGVGFRPFIYNLAIKHNLHGFVRNDSQGVEIDVQGKDDALDSFIRHIKENPPPLAKIYDFLYNEQLPHAVQDFQIIDSNSGLYNTTSISPDISICPDCLRELFDRDNRRFGYPFINCTNCGPRYSIILNVPYDRPYTSMGIFQMCSDCEKEYHDPTNRRFHAQPNACSVCGPQVRLLDRDGKLPDNDSIKCTVNLLLKGAIVAVKGLGGFHLLCDADNNECVSRLRERKRREAKPLAVMAKDLERIGTFAYYTDEESLLLTSPQRPIVLLPKNTKQPLAEQVAPAHKCYGVMIAYTPLHYLLLDSPLRAIVATSGNMTEEPIAISNEEALERLNTIADYFLIHNRDIVNRSDDSIARVINHKPALVRRSRGFVPMPILLSERLPLALGCGGELKNTLCYIRGNTAYLSQHIGDMENVQAIKFFHETEEHLSKILDIHPEIVAHDLHPEYYTSNYAQTYQNAKKVSVQHHHAHMVSCMAENGYSDKALGIILDGTGYGIDGNIWGGEVLSGDWNDFERLGHLEYIPMPGGDKAVHEPWRMGISYLYYTYGNGMYDLSLPVLQYRDVQTIDFLIRMIERGLNCPKTSSCGRLFDGVASILGIQMENRYEGQAAVEMEQLLNVEPVTESYPFKLIYDASPVQIPIKPIIEGIVDDFVHKIPISIIAAKFHNTIAHAFFSIVNTLQKQLSISTIVLSGGCFQNVYLSNYLRTLCEDAGLNVLTHAQVPSNDGGISLGQAIIGGKRMKTRIQSVEFGVQSAECKVQS